MLASTLTSKGRVTIPKDIRERLGLKAGDRLVFRFDDQGNLLVRPESRSPLGRLPGLLDHLACEKPATVEEMSEAVKRRAAARADVAVRERRRLHQLLEDLLDQMDAEHGPVDESLIEKYVGLLR